MTHHAPPSFLHYSFQLPLLYKLTHLTPTISSSSSSLPFQPRPKSSTLNVVKKTSLNSPTTSMAFWSAENATKAYLTTLKMGQRAKEPDVAEFISALAAGNNAQLMVVACGGGVPGWTTTEALVAASHQTGGRVICIVRNMEHLNACKKSLGISSELRQVEFVIGDPRELLTTEYDGADFVLVDCKLEKHEEIVRAVERVSGRKQNGTVVVGYNAFRSRGSFGYKTQFLPIGEGLLVTKFTGNISNNKNNNGGMNGRRSRWIVKVDKCTGEEHVFRVRFPQGKVIHA